MQQTSFGFGITGNTELSTVRAIARRSEALGFDSLWFNDTPGGDSLVRIEAAAAETSRLVLASGVISVDRRPAHQIVTEVRSRGLPQERLIVGIGSAARPGALGRIEESISVLRHELVTRVVIGALGPKMRRLGAERGNGLLFNWLTPPFVAETTRTMGDQAAAAGNAPVMAATYIRTALGEDALPRLEQEAARYSAIPSYAANFDRLGISAMESAVHGKTEEDVQKGLAAFIGTVDLAVVRAITPNDDLDHYLRLLEVVAPLIETRNLA